jgi:hypothetical protein
VAFFSEKETMIVSEGGAKTNRSGENKRISHTGTETQRNEKTKTDFGEPVVFAEMEPAAGARH